MCSDTRDKFSTTFSYGNGKLDYPVGLITGAEVALAGLNWTIDNDSNYLVNEQYFWTMSPSNFFSRSGRASAIYVNTVGLISSSGISSDAFSARPVINISSNVLVTEGDGSSETPYLLILE